MYVQTVWTKIDVTKKIANALSGLATSEKKSTDLAILGMALSI